MSTSTRVIKNTGYLYAKMFITMFISLYSTRLILKSLGASDFGIFNIVGGAIAMLGFLNAAMASTTQRFMSFSEGEGNKHKQKIIFNLGFSLHFLLSLIVGIILTIAGFIFFNGGLNIPIERIFAAKIVYCSLIISTIFTVMTVPYDALINAHENMKYYAIIGILESILKLITAVICVYTSKDKLITYGILMACIPLITLTIMRIYCHKKYEECVISPKKYWNKAIMKEMISFAGWNFVYTASGMITQYGLGIIINNYFGVILNAAQGIAVQVSGVLMAFSQNAMKSLKPMIDKNAGAKHLEKSLYISLLGCRVSFCLFGLFSLPFIFEMDFFLNLWLEKVPQWAVIFCQLQLIRILLEQLTLSLSSAINAQGEIKYYNLWKSILNFLPLCIIPFLFKNNFAPYWMYIVWIICWSILGGFVSIIFAHKKVNLSYKRYTNEIIIPAIIVGCTTTLLYHFLENIINTRIISLILIVLYYMLLSFLLLFHKNERNQLIMLITNITNKIKK